MDVTPKKSVQIWLYLFAGLLVVLGAGVLGIFGFDGFPRIKVGRTASDANPLAARLDAPAPDFELVSLAGDSVRLSDYRGKRLMINFWATWCTPCVREMPILQKYYEVKYPGQFEVLAVNADETNREVQQFASDMVLTFPVLLDPGGKVQQLYQLRGYPTTFFVDEDGMIRYEQIGEMQADQLDDYLSKMGVSE